MTEKLYEAEKRYEEISSKLSDASVISDQEQYKKLMKEFKNLSPLVEMFRKYKKADVLRSPHLYMEHFISPIVDNDEVYRWFTTNGIYTSCHSMISRVLQFDQRSN